MSKQIKKNNAVQLSPEESAKAKATILLDYELQKAELEKNINVLKAELTQFIKDGGTNDLGAYNVTVGEQKPKISLDHLTDNGKKRIIEQLMVELPEFKKVKEEMDWEKIYYAITVNPKVANALKVRDLKFELQTPYTFRKVKS